MSLLLHTAHEQLLDGNLSAHPLTMSTLCRCRQDMQLVSAESPLGCDACLTRQHVAYTDDNKAYCCIRGALAEDAGLLLEAAAAAEFGCL